MSDKQHSTFVQDLWDRRFFQFIGTYLGVSFGLVQFAEFVEGRYGLENNLVEKVLLFLSIMLPAVVVFVYNHGRKGDDQWKPFEKVFIPASLIAALGVSVVMFNRAEIITEEVTITTEEGDTVTRLIPSSSSAKRLAVFPFEVESVDPEREWVGLAVPWLIDHDLEQDMRTFAVQPFSMKEEYDSYNVEFLTPIPFPTRLKIAQDNYTDYFISGKITEQSNGLELMVRSHNTNTGRIFYEDTIRASSIFGLVDNFSQNFSKHLYIKDAAFNEAMIDLPASGLVTHDEKALEYVVSALRQRSPNQIAPAILAGEKAIEIDPNCAECYAILANYYLQNSQEAKANEAAKNAVQKSELLPERQRLKIGYFNYLINERLDQARALMENWQKLYPRDQTPYSNLMMFHNRNLELDKAKEVGRLALDNGHRGTILVELARLYIQTEEYEEAEKYLSEFSEKYPHKAKERSLLGEIYIAQGDLEKAREFYEDLKIVRPNEVEFILKLADIYDKQGEFEKTQRLLNDALKSISNNVRDSISIIQSLEGHYDRLGMLEKSFTLLRQREKLMANIYPRLQVLNVVFNQVWPKYLSADREEYYRASFDEFRSLLPTRSDMLDCQEEYTYAIYKKDAEVLQSMSEECQQVIFQITGPHFQMLLKAVINEAEGDFQSAVENYENFLDSTGLNQTRFSIGLSEVYRKNKQLGKAKAVIDKLLDGDPNQPVYLLEAARISNEDEDQEKARELLDRSLAIWQNADSTYQFFREALELRDQMAQQEN